MEIDRAWAENVFVTKANLLHSRVHDPEKYYTTAKKKVFTAVPVYRDEEVYNIYGITDCIEAGINNDGITLPGLPGKYQLSIVEYKPTKPKNAEYNEDDLMQVFAQKICVDSVFGGKAEGILYYADVKKRVKLPLNENYAIYDEHLRQVLDEMRKRMEYGEIPEIRKGQKCNGCSMKDLCMPAIKRKYHFRESLMKIQEEM